MRRRSVLVVGAFALAAVGVATPAWAFWSVGSSNASGTAAAGALGTPTVSTSGVSATSVTIAVTAAPTSGPAPTGYRVARTAPGATVSSVCTITGATGGCTDSAPVASATNTYQVYARFTTGGATWESFDPATTTAAVGSADSTPPTHALSLSAVSGGAYLTGGGASWTLYYRGSAAGSVKLTDALADSGSGPASVSYPAVTATGWTHAAETVSTPAGGPFTSSAFAWTASPTNPASYSVTGADVAGNTATATVAFTNDSAAPTGGSISYANGYVTGSVAITTTDGTDAGSGIDTRQVQRAAATLANSGVCGSFGAYGPVTLTGGADTGITNGTCYQYRYLVTDRVGNQATYTSASIVKVDTTAPTVTAVALANGTGGQAGTVGRADNNDTVTITFSEAMDASKFCSTWSSTGTQSLAGNGQVVVTITEAGANDTLTVATSTGCTFRLGTVALGGDYVSATTTFSGSTGNSRSSVTWDLAANNSNALTIALGSMSSTASLKTNVAAGTPVYTPASGLTDLAGNALGTAPVTGAASRF